MMKLLLLTILFFPLTTIAQLQLAKIFTDNMVLQRGKPIIIYGTAPASQTVSVNFNNETKKVIADEVGNWKLIFKKQDANKNPQTIIVSNEDQKITIHNILIGDVWLCIGQSNMEFPMEKEMHYAEARPLSNQPLLRFYNPTYAGKNTYNIAFSDSIINKLTPQKFYDADWQSSDSNSIRTMSAVAYYFGKQIIEHENIPIGLINISMGGAPLESFISEAALKNSKQFAGKFNGNWLSNNELPVWIRERGIQNVGGLKNVPADEYGPNHAFKPSFAYEAGVVPLFNFSIKGILCYQGESNAQEMDRVNEYASLSKLMVDDFRNQWQQPSLPFYFVQLSSIDSLKYKSQLWPMFRDEQRKMLTLIPNSGMAVSSDLGFKNDVHPTNKKAVGIRLAKWALKKTYHEDVTASGPLPRYAKYKNGKIIIKFKYAVKGLKTSDKAAAYGFSLDGVQNVAAVLKDDTIIIASKSKPEFIYYGWEPFTRANIVNPVNLPASTFKIVVR